MKVLLVIPSFYPAVIYGGPIFSTYHVCSELSKLDGVEVFVATTNTNMTSKLNVAKNKWVEFNPFFKVIYYDEFIVDKFSLKLFLRVWNDIRQSDVVHIQSLFSLSTPISLIYAMIFNKKVLLSPRGSLGQWCLEHGNKFKAIWLKCAIGTFVKDVVWHSTANQEKNEILAVFPNAKVEVIPNGIEFEKFSFSNKLEKQQYLKYFLNFDLAPINSKVVVSMGRLQKKKGFDVLIRAFVNVVNKFPAAKLLIAGDDEGELSSLLLLVKELSLTESVFFIGSISGQDKIDFLANADLFALPSHNENFGNVYVESLAAGTPIVASTNTPWSEVEDADCGKWVTNSINDTSVAMLEMLNKDRETMRANAQKHAVKYDWENIASQFRDLFETMANSS